MFSPRISTLLLMAAAAALISPAQVVMYTSRASWRAAAGNATTIDFGAAATPSAGSYRTFSTLTLSGVTFSNTQAAKQIYVASRDFCCPTYARGYDQLTSPHDGTGVQVALPANTTAVGFDLFAVVSGNESGTDIDQVDVVIGGKKYVVQTPAAPNAAFVGFVSTTPISGLTVTAEQGNGQTQADLMNFSFAIAPAAGSVPTVAGVLNGADFSSHLAPGVIAAVYGTNFGTGPASGITLTVGGKQGAVLGVAANQLTVQLPVDAPTGASSLTVTIAGATSAAFPITLDAYAPAIFSANGSGSGAGLIRSAANATITTVAPAKPGDNLVAYAVGLGATSPATPTGSAPGAANPTVVQPSITVGGLAATITYAGVAPSLVGTYQINFTVPAGLQGTQPVMLTIGGKSSTPVTLALFGISTVLSNASFGSAGTAAPGSIVSVFANGIGGVDQTVGFPATSFQGVSVSFNGTAAPIFHLVGSQGQIDVLVPYELPVSGKVNVQVKTPSATSLNYSLTMAEATPGLYFITDPGTPGRYNALAQIANTAWLVMPDSMASVLKIPGNCTATNVAVLSLCGQPASTGDYLVLYATGLGKATDASGNQLKTGAIPPADGSVLFQSAITPTVTVGGLPAKVVFAGIAPGYPGLYQVDIQVPAGIAGDDVPVTIGVGTSPVDTRTIAVRAK